jgi:hypothetical protein
LSKPQISVRRPARPQSDLSASAAPSPIAPAPVPAIDPDSPEAMAYAMRGRSAGSAASIPERTPKAAEIAPSPEPPQPPTRHERDKPEPDTPAVPELGRRNADSDTARSHRETGISEDDLRPLSIKLPPDVGRKLADVADRRGSKRTHVAIEALTPPLRRLAAEHRAGRYPELPKVISGSVRTSVAFSLPADLAADLNYVLAIRRAVKAQVITRLLVPAIEEIYTAEFQGR